MASLLKVSDIVGDPALDTAAVAGLRGLERTVRWAQTSESAQPWKWLGNEELLLTLGINLPQDASGQMEFIQQAAAAGLAGVGIGQDGLAPELTRQMLDTADELGFPILSVGPQTPFVVLSRTVAAVTTNELNRGVLVLSRLYQEAGSQSLQQAKSGEWIERLCSIQVCVQDTETGCAVIGELPAQAVRRHSLPTLRSTQLLVPADADLDALVLVHLKQILSVDSNRILQDAHSRVEAGERDLRTALEGRGEPLIGTGSFRAACLAASKLERLALSLALNGLPALASSWKQHAVALVREADLPFFAGICKELNASAGVSAPFHRVEDLGGAAQEAMDALPSDPAAAGVHEYEGGSVSLLARSASEAEQIIDTVLGPLASLTPQVSVYRQSLFALLDNDLAWQETAAQLSVHRQTLAYRVKQAQSLCGRSVRRVADLSELYLARKAWLLRGKASG